MKAIGWKGLVALAALLVVPLTATPVMAETGTWFLNGDLGGGVFITNHFEVPCDILNAQAGAGGLTDHVLMGIRLENVNGVAGTLSTLRIQSRNTQPDCSRRYCTSTNSSPRSSSTGRAITATFSMTFADISVQ